MLTTTQHDEMSFNHLRGIASSKNQIVNAQSHPSETDEMQSSLDQKYFSSNNKENIDKLISKV
jgi:hypothetical protein